MSERRLTGCFKYGCLGCLSLVALGIVLIFLFGAIQMSMDTEPTLEQQELAQELPAPPLPPEAPAVGTPGSSSNAAPAVPGMVEGAMVEDSGIPQRIEVSPKRGRVVLDLSMGNFTIKPGPPGDPIRVEADYDTNAFRLKESFDSHSGGNWVYSLSFGPKGGWLGSLLRGGSEIKNEVVLVIPEGQPIELTGTIGVGESETDLGGLWIESVDLEMGIGEHFLEISEPTPQPIASFAVDSSLGEVELRQLGNGSPESLSVEHGIGEILIDLEGQWLRDATVDVDFRIGSCRLWLPDDVHVDVQGSGVSVGDKRIDSSDGDAIPAGAPTLTLELSGSIGELSVER